MTEAELKRTVIFLAHKYGWLVYHAANRWGQRNTSKGNGFPDLVLARSEVVMFMELKQEKGVMSIEQALWFAQLPSVFIIRPHDLDDGTVERLLQ